MSRASIKAKIEKKLADRARAVLKRYHPRVIDITGSVGKTTTRQAIKAVMSAHFRTRASQYNYNTEWGVPLTILGEQSPGKSFFNWWRLLRRARALSGGVSDGYPEVLILEMASDRPGDLSKLVKIARPNVAVVTDVSESHLKYFKTQKLVAQEKSILVRSLRETGLAVLNADNEWTKDMANLTAGKKMMYGFGDNAAVRAFNDKPTSEITITKDLDPELDLLAQNGFALGTAFALFYKGQTVSVKLPRVLGRQSVYAALAAATVGLAWGLELSQISTALLKFVPAPGRMNLIAGIKKTLLIDDTYNASPVSSLAALNALDRLNVKGRKIAILGDMTELGPATESGHAQVGEKVAKVADFGIFVGSKMKFAAGTAQEAGLIDERQTWVQDARQVEAVIQPVLKPGDVVLVKGSRVMKMERVVKSIMATPLRAPQLLVKD